MLATKVIVMEPSDLQARSIEAMIRFLDLKPVRVEDFSELARSGGPHDWLAVILSADTLATHVASLVAHLRAMEEPLPIIYLSGDGLPRIAETSGDLAWLPLELPVKQRRLSAVLTQAQKLRDGHPTQPGAHRFRPSGQSRAMRELHRLIEQVAPHDTSVLVLGESGTGKELVARHLHELSGRAGHPFVPVNCGAIPGDLLESELFGHEKGAFTGALSARVGRFEFAEGGTLFLDEIGDMSLQMQVKLLRVLQERSFERVGSNRTLRCDVRIVAATHRDLEAAIVEGRFREDLYYRLNVFPIQMPPLRDRPLDLPVLIEHLLHRHEQSAGRRVRLDEAAMNCLARNRWPGNVRELSNLLERLAILYPGQIVTAAELPERYRVAGTGEWPGTAVRIVAPTAAATLSSAEQAAPGVDSLDAEDVALLLERPGNSSESGTAARSKGGIDLKDHLSAIEIDLIRKALIEAQGTVAEAARLLNIRRTTLVEKLRKYGLGA